MNVVRSFVNYAIFCELCDRMQFEVDCAKLDHRVIPEGLIFKRTCTFYSLESMALKLGSVGLP